jgi:protein-disulfide isomerase
MGPASPGLTIVEFGDFQCPFCQKTALYLKELRRRYPREVAVVYRHYPGHQFAMPAAIASQCADRKGAFEALHDLFYAQRDSIGVKPWNRFALEAGIVDTLAFDVCMRDGAAAREVAIDTLAAHRLGVTGTPTLLFNEVRIEGYIGSERMDTLVVESLRRARK